MSQENTKKNVINDFVFSGPALVEASAGTGKTYTITGLIVRLLLGDARDEVFNPLPIEKIAVMTFTTAATADLRRKIRERIHEVRMAIKANAVDSGDELVKHLLAKYSSEEESLAAGLLLEKAERDIDRASITTIHAFCGGQLRRYATDASLAMNMTLVNDDKDIRKDALVYALRELVYNRELDKIFAQDIGTTTDSNSSYGFLRFLRKAKLLSVDSLLGDFGNYKPENTYKFKRPVFNDRELCYGSLEELAQEFFYDGEKLVYRLDTSLNLTEGLVKNIVKDCFYRRALEIFEKLKNNLGVLTMDDYLFRLDYALKTNDKSGEMIAASVRKQYPVMFIDEFQDTDPVQFSIVKQIYLNYFKHERNLAELIKKTGVPVGFYIIGDPKQAIYSFRGADINCYLNAKRDICLLGGKLYTLDTNYRSDAVLVNAVNLLFAKEISALNDVSWDATAPGQKISMGRNNQITFSPVKSAPNRNKPNFKCKNLDYSSFNIMHLDCDDAHSSKVNYEGILARNCAKVIAELLNPQNECTLNDRPIQYKDIAVLVRTAEEAAKIRNALSALGLPSVYGSERGVVQCTEEFQALVWLIEAVLTPQKTQLVRLLTSSLFTFTGEELDKLLSEDGFELLVRFMMECGAVLREQGIMSMMLKFFSFKPYVLSNNHIIDSDNKDRDVHADSAQNSSQTKLLEAFDAGLRQTVISEIRSRANGSQIFTNIMHVTEIAQAFSLNAKNPETLLTMMSALVNNAEGTRELDETGIDSKLRLPSEENLIQIVTYHASKGLEYPIVFMPFASSKRSRPTNGEVQFAHTYSGENKGNNTNNENNENNEGDSEQDNPADNEQGQLSERCIDISIVDKEEEKTHCFNDEEYFESCRLWYVALTRARSAMFIWMVTFSEKKNNSDIRVPLRDSFENLSNMDDDMLIRFKETFSNITSMGSNSFEDYFNIIELSVKDCALDARYKVQKPGEDDKDAVKEVVVPATQMIDDAWHITSYSGLTKNHGLHKVSEPKNDEGADEEGEQPNNENNPDALKARETVSSNLSRFNFPRNAAVGTFLHSVMEETEFCKIENPADMIKSVNEILSVTPEWTVPKDWRDKSIDISIDKNADAIIAFDNADADAKVDFEELTPGYRELLQWMYDVVTTPLADFTLNDIPDNKCAREMEFLLNVPNRIRANTISGDTGRGASRNTDDKEESFGDSLTNEENLKGLNDIINDFYKKHDERMHELVSHSQVSFNEIRGLMTGFIDLLVQHDGKFYVIDYKSNYLGDKVDDYSPEGMKEAVAEHRYDIQYILYTVAVQRFLKKLYGRHYSYDNHIGGVRYLFLRGMCGKQSNIAEDGSTSGVYCLSLPQALVDEVDQYLGGEE